MKKRVLKTLALALCFVMLFTVSVFAAQSPDTGNNSGNEATEAPTKEDHSGAQSPDTDNNSGNETEDPTKGSEAEDPTNGSGTEDPTKGNETENPSVSNVEALAKGVTADQVVFNGKELTVTIAPISSEDILNDALQQAQTLVNKDASILKLFDVSLPDGDYSAGVQIKFNVAEIQAGQNVSVLHQRKDGSWENLKVDQVENGAVTATFTSFSPVAIVVSATAPGTGDDSSTAKLLVVLAAVAALSGAAFCVYRKKLSANE